MTRMMVNKYDIEFFQDYGLLTEKRIVYLSSMTFDGDEEGGVEFVSGSVLIKNLLYLDSLCDSPIKIIINTPGGSWSHGMAIFDMIKSLRSPVEMLGIGQVMSMGTIILQAGVKRYLTPNTTFMIHDGSTTLNGSVKTVQAWVKNEEKVLHNMYSIYLSQIKKKHPKFTFKQVEDMCSTDCIMSAREAVDLGLADGIVEKMVWK